MYHNLKNLDNLWLLLIYERSLNLKIIAITIAFALFFTSAGYTFRLPIGDTFQRKVSPIRKPHLRVPLVGAGKTQHIPKRNHTVDVLLKEMLKKDLDRDTEDIENIMKVLFDLENRHPQKKTLDALIEDISRAGEKRVGFLRIMLDLAKKDEEIDGLLAGKLGMGYREQLFIQVSNLEIIGDGILISGEQGRDLAIALLRGDIEPILNLANRQKERGVWLIDVHGDGLKYYPGCNLNTVVRKMEWMIEELEKIDGIYVVADTAYISVLAKAALVAKKRVVLNSLTDSERIERIVPYIEKRRKKGLKTGIVVSAIRERGEKKMREGQDLESKWDTAQRVIRTMDGLVDYSDMRVDFGLNSLGKLVEYMTLKQFQREGVDVGDIEPVFFTEIFPAMRNLREQYPEIKITVGVRNVSIKGTHYRRLLNRTITLMGMACGLDSPIADLTDPLYIASIEVGQIIMQYWKAFTDELATNNDRVPLGEKFLDTYIAKLSPELRGELEEKGYNLCNIFNRALIPISIMLRAFRERKIEDGLEWYKYELIPLGEMWMPEVDEDDIELQVVLKVVRLMLGDEKCIRYIDRKGVNYLDPLESEPEYIVPYMRNATKEDLLVRLKVARKMFDKGILFEEERIFLEGLLLELIENPNTAKDIVEEAKSCLADVKRSLPDKRVRDIVDACI